MTTQDVAETTTSYVFHVHLENGEELRADAGHDADAARAQLAALHARTDTEAFLLLGDTMVRSRDIRYVQLRTEDSSRRGVLDAVKSRMTGGDDMSTFDTERTTEMWGPRGAGARAREHGGGPGFADQWVGYGRRPWAETKPFFLTSEFLTLVGIIAGIAVAMGSLDNFNANRGWLLITIIGAAYMISRGLAKSGTRDPRPDGRDFGE